MALYDYGCRKCGKETEVCHPMREERRVVCPRCGARMRKLITETPHIQLNWKAWDRNETGSSRMLIRAGKRGKSTPMGTT